MTITPGLFAEKRDFSSVLRESIQNGIRNVLGEGVLQAVRSRLQIDKCSQQPEEFHGQLSPIFGEGGAKTLETVIVKDLFQKLNLPITERRPFTFEAYVDQARIRMLNQQRVVD